MKNLKRNEVKLKTTACTNEARVDGEVTNSRRSAGHSSTFCTAAMVDRVAFEAGIVLINHTFTSQHEEI